MLVGSNFNLSGPTPSENTTQQTIQSPSNELAEPNSSNPLALVSLKYLDFYINLMTLVVGLLVAAAAALDEFFQPGQKFRDYRNAAENLQIQGWQYLQLTGPYNQFATHSAAFSAFTRHVEEIIEQDVQRFVSRIDDRLEEDKRKTEEQLQKIEDNQDKLARQIRQQMMQAETERQLARKASTNDDPVASTHQTEERLSPMDLDRESAERIAFEEIVGETSITNLSPHVKASVQRLLIDKDYMTATDNFNSLPDIWAQFKTDQNQGKVDKIGPGSLRLLITPSNSNTASPNISNGLTTRDSKTIETSTNGKANNSGSALKIATNFIKKFEGFEPNAYQDPKHGWSLPTIGYGTTVYADEQPVKRGQTITEPEAEQALIKFIEQKCRPLLEKIPTWNQMNPNQKAALYSFAYNLGPMFYEGKNFDSITNLCKSPNLWNNRSEVIKIFEKYCNPKDKSVTAGLKRRRGQEAELFLKQSEPIVHTTEIGKTDNLRFVRDPNPPLMVRSGPGREHKKVATITNGSPIHTIEELNGWLRIKSPEGWVAMQYTEKAPGTDKPAPDEMSESEKYNYYRKIIEQYGEFDIENNKRNLLGFRKQTDADINNKHGQYDDFLAMVWMSSGTPFVREYTRFNTDPISRYLAKDFGVDADGDGRKDLGRIPAGHYKYMCGKQKSKHYGLSYLIPMQEIIAERDTNHDGLFQPEEKRATSKRTMLIHKGGEYDTGSAGCQTLPPTEFDRFWLDLKANGDPGTLGYTLVNWE